MKPVFNLYYIELYVSGFIVTCIKSDVVNFLKHLFI